MFLTEASVVGPCVTCVVMNPSRFSVNVRGVVVTLARSTVRFSGVLPSETSPS